MNDHSRRFVDDDNRIVFVQDIQRNVFSNRGGIRIQFNPGGYLLSRYESVGWFGRFSVDLNLSLGDCQTKFGTAERFEAF